MDKMYSLSKSENCEIKFRYMVISALYYQEYSGYINLMIRENSVYLFMTVHVYTCRWLRICLKSKLKEVFPAVVKFVTNQGRMKFVRPLYR